MNYLMMMVRHLINMTMMNIHKDQDGNYQPGGGDDRFDGDPDDGDRGECG